MPVDEAAALIAVASHQSIVTSPLPPNNSPSTNSMQSKDKGFLNLPAELRNFIYQDLLMPRGYITLPAYGEQANGIHLSILRVNRQCYYEANRYLYTNKLRTDVREGVMFFARRHQTAIMDINPYAISPEMLVRFSRIQLKVIHPRQPSTAECTASEYEANARKIRVLCRSLRHHVYGTAAPLEMITIVLNYWPCEVIRMWEKSLATNSLLDTMNIKHSEESKEWKISMYGGGRLVSPYE
ncbi:MAG: hypothetical protein M1827_001893 [Pycnora praestabilis]|nr:MAG: hypothetical protein M1827_001893 [Pycnora praestabilis]